MKSIIKYLDESLFKNQEQIKRMVKHDEMEFVDLGLPSGVLWGKCNLGAENETESGHYYMWGSIEPNDNDYCTWANTPFNNNQKEYDSEYFKSIKNEVCPNDWLLPEYDAATIELGNDYRIPITSDMYDLVKFTNNKWVENYKNSNANGILFINKMDETKYIFIPASGFKIGNTILRNGVFGEIWTSQIMSNNQNANILFITKLNLSTGYISRATGLPIRPICQK